MIKTVQIIHIYDYSFFVLSWKNINKLAIPGKMSLNITILLYRRWSKKYPICITIEKGALIENVALKDCHNKETNTIKHSKKIIEEDTENQLDKKKDKDEDDKQIEQEAEDEIDDEDDGDETDEDSTHTRTLRNSFTDHSENDQNDICKLFIFARADRQKEDW